MIKPRRSRLQDTVVVMHQGAIVQTGSPQELFDRPERYLRRLFYWIARHEHPAGPHRGRQSFASTATQFRWPKPIRPSRAQPTWRSAFDRNSRSSRRLAWALPSSFDRIDDLGRVRIARAQLGGRRIAVRVPDRISERRRDCVGCSIDPAKIHVYVDSRRVEAKA